MTSPKILLRAWDLKAKKRWGQHFLTDPSAAEMIVSRARITSKDIVLEIGAGLGALTIPIAGIAEKVLAVEKDPRICDLLKTELMVNHISNVKIIPKNILEIDYQPLAEEYGRPLIVIGNLPYNISSQILIQLIHSRKFAQRAILMFQQELARRIMAQPGSRDYGRLTVMVQYCAEIKEIASIDASFFFPVPKVASQILELRFATVQKYAGHNEALLFRVIKAAFGNRRKTLKNALAASELHIDPQIASNALIAAGINPGRRAETLTVPEFIRLQINLGETLAARLEAG